MWNKFFSRRWKDLHKNCVEIHTSCPGVCGVRQTTWILFLRSNLSLDFGCYFQRVSSLWCGLNYIIFDSTWRIESTNTSTLFVKENDNPNLDVISSCSK